MGCLIDRVRAKFRTLHFANVTFLGSLARAQVTSLHIAISFDVAILCMKDRESLQEASGKLRNLCSFPSIILFSPFSQAFLNSFQAS